MSVEIVREGCTEDGYYKTWEGYVDDIRPLADCVEVYVGHLVLTIFRDSGLPIPAQGDMIRFDVQLDESGDLAGKITNLEFV